MQLATTTPSSVVHKNGPTRYLRAGKRYGAIATALGAACIALACMALAQSTAGGRTVEVLQSMLCCDGCCVATVSVASAIVDRDAAVKSRASILHVSGTSEIDYTAGGHRVSQHMESALSELDHLEDHVKNGRPKFLTESAAQREADLASGKFAHQDLEGDQQELAESNSPSSSAKTLVDPYAQDEQEQLATEARQTKKDAAMAKQKAKQQLAAEKTAAQSHKIVQKVAEATQIIDSLNRQEHKDTKSFSKPLHTLSKGVRTAESDAARTFKSILHIKGEDSGSWAAKHTPKALHRPQALHALHAAHTLHTLHAPHAPRAAGHSASIPTSTNTKGGFEPITSDGWGPVLRAKAAVGSSTSAADPKDAADEALLRQLAQSDRSQAQPPALLRHAVDHPPSTATPSQHTAAHTNAVAEKATAHTDEGVHAPSTPRAVHGKKVVGATAGGRGGDAQAHGDEKRLNGVLSRINNLISSQTGGANRHPTYFKHFDSEAQAAAAKLAAVHKQAQAKLAAASSSVHSSQLQPAAASAAKDTRGSAASSELSTHGAHSAGGSAAHVKAAHSWLAAARKDGGGGELKAARGGRARASDDTSQLHEVGGGVGSRTWGMGGGGQLAGSGVALKEEEMLYGSHHDLDSQGVKALQHSSLLGLGL